MLGQWSFLSIIERLPLYEVKNVGQQGPLQNTVKSIKNFLTKHISALLVMSTVCLHTLQFFVVEGIGVCI